MANPNSQQIAANHRHGEFADDLFRRGLVRILDDAFVTLSSNYARSPPTHYPDCNSRRRSAGTSLTGWRADDLERDASAILFSAEAAALVAAGAGVYS